MPNVDSLPPGSFCWPELATTDQKAAVAFYQNLFGWDVNDQPMGPDETYSMFQLRGREVGAAYNMRPEERESGAPPHWNSYVSVTNADEAAKKAESLGGKVVMKPFDVMEAGRMAVIQDPTGAFFQVWQAGRSIGTRVQREPGSLTWTELSTGDTKKAEQFYTQLFGWKSKVGGEGVNEYTEFSVNDMPGAGMMDSKVYGPNNQVPPNWMPYFQVSDTDATANKAKELGGKAMVPPTDIPNVGRFSVLQDPQGAVFAIIRMNPR
jgi:predicted enzyme related to lactoylglutathione lyase